jgi:hypothetical protein
MPVLPPPPSAAARDAPSGGAEAGCGVAPLALDVTAEVEPIPTEDTSLGIGGDANGPADGVALGAVALGVALGTGAVVGPGVEALPIVNVKLTVRDRVEASRIVHRNVCLPTARRGATADTPALRPT